MPTVPCPGLALTRRDRAGDTRQCCQLWVGPVGWGAGSAQSFALGAAPCPALCPFFQPLLSLLWALPPLAQLCSPSRLCHLLPSSLFPLLALCSLPGSLPSPQVCDAAEDQSCPGATENSADPSDLMLIPALGHQPQPGLCPGPVCPVPLPRAGSPAGQGMPGSPLGVLVVPLPWLCPHR